MPDAIKPCPPATQLERLLAGKLSNGTAAAVDAHLDCCDACVARIASMRIDSRLMTILTGRLAGEGGAPSLRLEDLMTTLEALVPSSGEPGDAPEPETDDFAFLEPAAAPGEMGTLAQYRVVRMLGRGGMGWVFHAEDTRLKRAVGLKVLRRTNDPVACARFLSEARAMAAVKHDHIAVVYEVGETRSVGAVGTPYLAMELLEGQSLDAWMRNHRRTPVEWVLRIGREAAEGLAAAHAAGLIHRDVKPSNLWLEAPTGRHRCGVNGSKLLGEVGRVKLIDFGLAADLEELEAEDLCIGGTPGYMAPEQMRGEAINGIVDIYALGCVLYELSTGKHPFPGRGVHVRLLTSRPVPVRERNPAVPVAFARLVEQMLEVDPAKRPSGAGEVATRLAGIEEQVRTSGVRFKRRLFAATTAVVVSASTLVYFGANNPTVSQPSATTAIADGDGTTAPAESAKLPVISFRDQLELLVAPREVAVGVHEFPAGPPDQAWCNRAAELEPRDRLSIVAAKFAELNPQFGAHSLDGRFSNGVLDELMNRANCLTDIRPVRAFREVRFVRFSGNPDLSDVSPLNGLKISELYLHGNPLLKDLSPLRGMPLTRLDISQSRVASLDDVDGSKLELLRINGTEMKYLDFVRRMPNLHRLECRGCDIKSFEPLLESNVAELFADVDPKRDFPVLKRMKSLTKLNGRPPATYFRLADAGKP